MDTSAVILNWNLYRFSNFWKSLRWSVLIAIFHAVKEKTYGRNNNYESCLQNWSLILSNTILKWSHIHSNRFLCMNKKAIFEGRDQILLFLRLLNSHLAILKNILELEQWTIRNQEFRQWTKRKQRGPQRNSRDISPMYCKFNRYISNSKLYVIPPICFLPLRNGNDETRRGSYFLLELFIFVHIFSFYLVPQSL
jgi:hypothetical protein